MTPHVFYHEYTMGQYLNLQSGYYKRVNREYEDRWLQTREVVYYLYNNNVTKPSQLRTREQLLSLPSDAPKPVRPADHAKQADLLFGALDAHLADL